MDSAHAQIEELRIKITQANLPSEVSEKLLNLLKITVAGSELDSLITYVDFIISLPFGRISEDILDINRAKQILDKNHYGLQSVKNRILEYLSVLILNRRNPERAEPFGSEPQVFDSEVAQTRGGRRRVEGHAPILAFIGLVGTGKTSLAYSIAESLGRPIARIPFGGLGDPTILRGQSRHDIDAEPGQIIKAIKACKVNNPVILLDEIDRVAEEHRVDIMGVLVELLDPAQNQAFLDHYLDFPYDLSQVLFIATANNTGNIATAVLDRLEPIMMPSYSDEEKLIIGKDYLLPKAIEEAGINNNVLIIDESTWPQILRPLGFDSGIRSLLRSLQAICRKVARKVVEGSIGPFKITSENLGEYLGG